MEVKIETSFSTKGVKCGVHKKFLKSYKYYFIFREKYKNRPSPVA